MMLSSEQSDTSSQLERARVHWLRLILLWLPSVSTQPIAAGRSDPTLSQKRLALEQPNLHGSPRAELWHRQAAASTARHEELETLAWSNVVRHERHAGVHPLVHFVFRRVRPFIRRITLECGCRLLAAMQMLQLVQGLLAIAAAAHHRKR